MRNRVLRVAAAIKINVVRDILQQKIKVIFNNILFFIRHIFIVCVISLANREEQSNIWILSDRIGEII